MCVCERERERETVCVCVCVPDRLVNKVATRMCKCARPDLSLGRCCLGAGGTATAAVFFGGGTGSVADIFDFGSK